MIQLITCTGGRPEAFALCQRWMAAQDYTGTVRWIIVDDCDPETPVTFQRASWLLVHVRPRPAWQPGQNTQARNMLAGLAAIDPAHPCLVVEDDDHYQPGWLTYAAEQLEHVELVGEHMARYYNVRTRLYRQLSNTQHASLCSTGFRGAKALAALKQACLANAKFIDLHLWRHWRGSKRLFGGEWVTGIKGLPGRGGIGIGHRMSGHADPDGRVLRRWIGDDAEAYL